MPDGLLRTAGGLSGVMPVSEEITMKQIHSRRALLAGAPAAAAGALLAGTAVNALAIGVAKAGETDADAELLSLKPEVDDVLGDWIRQMTKDSIERREWVNLHVAKFGFEPGDKPEIDWNDPEFVAYDRDVRRLISEHHSGRSEDELELRHWDRIHDKLNPLVDKVLSYTASTLEGLRLQTRVLIIYYNEIWSPLNWEADESDQPEMCAFFASLCCVLGVPFPPVPERWQS
jgi:hypothetical protein